MKRGWYVIRPLLCDFVTVKYCGWFTCGFFELIYGPYKTEDEARSIIKKV